MLQKRIAGRTGFELTEYGLGAWSLGGVRYGEMDRAKALSICREYVEVGGNFFDTARVYQDSEEVIGDYLKESGKRQDLYIASKTVAGQYADSLPDIRKDIETTLRKLRTDYLDIYFLHQPPEEIEVMNSALEIMGELKKEGKIRAIGASIKGPNVTAVTEDLCNRYIDTGQVDVIQLVYSILRQKLRDVIHRAHAEGVAIVARTSLESGLLTGRYKPGHRFEGEDHRTRYKPENLDFILEKVQELQSRVVRLPYESMAQVAMNFARSHPGVTTTIVGATSVRQVEDTAKAMQLPLLDDELLEMLHREYGNLTEKTNYQ